MSDHGGQLPGPEFLAAAVPALLFLWMWWHWWRFARLLKDVPHTPVLGIFVGLVETAGGGFAVGDRVLWVNQAGSYAERLAVPASRLNHP